MMVFNDEKSKKKDNRRLTAITSRMRIQDPFDRIDLGTCVVGQVANVINDINGNKFFENRSTGFRATRPQITAFPIDIAFIALTTV